MASKNIVAKGTTYNGVESVTFPVSGGGDATFYEISDTTASASDVLNSKYFYTSSGIKTQGTGTGGSATLITKNITANGTYNASSDNADGYSSVTVSVSGGSSNIVQGTFTTSATTGSASTFVIPYNGTGYPIGLYVYIKGGILNNTSGGDSNWYNLVQRYAVGAYYMTKSRTTTAPSYESSTGTLPDRQGTVLSIYKSNATDSTAYTRGFATGIDVFGESSGEASSTACIRFLSDTTISYFVASTSYGLVASTEYEYIAVYSS